MSEIVQKAQRELSINGNTKRSQNKLMLTFLGKLCSIIQRLDSYKLLTNKTGLKSDLSNLQTRSKKAKKRTGNVKLTQL